MILLGRGKVPDQRFCSSVLGDLPGWVAPALLLFLVSLVIMGMIVLNKAEGAIEVETLTWAPLDQDIEAVVDEAALLD